MVTHFEARDETQLRGRAVSERTTLKCHTFLRMHRVTFDTVNRSGAPAAHLITFGIRNVAAAANDRHDATINDDTMRGEFIAAVQKATGKQPLLL